ncbi:hypothetical protein DFH11DRAFT_392357 [Phellopilus nigrolimitatus]|nr:hypothetical protein DFH11DRAFT_392357 [Phellopilus nigrolimitatus]
MYLQPSPHQFSNHILIFPTRLFIYFYYYRKRKWRRRSGGKNEQENHGCADPPPPGSPRLASILHAPGARSAFAVRIRTLHAVIHSVDNDAFLSSYRLRVSAAESPVELHVVLPFPAGGARGNVSTLCCTTKPKTQRWRKASDAFRYYKLQWSRNYTPSAHWRQANQALISVTIAFAGIYLYASSALPMRVRSTLVA